MSPHARVVLVLLCLALVVTVGAGSGVVEAAQTTPPHDHPDEIDDDSDPESVAVQLEAYLLNSIRESAATLGNGNHDRAASLVGADYDRRLEQFEQVSGEAGREHEAAAFEAVRDEQRRFIDATEAYDETYAEYRDARNAGDEQRARELARELEEHHRTAQETGSRLESEYETVESVSDGSEEADLEAERTTVRAIRDDIEQRQEDIQSVEFTETTLTAEAESTDVSFLEPLALRGELRAADGTPIANQEATFVIEGRETTTTTDSTGQFTLVHRPTTMPLGTERVTIQYAPADESTYLGSNAAVPVTVEQVEPTVEVAAGPDEAAFGDDVIVRGSVTADGTGAEGVPVSIELGGEHVGTMTTDENGAYETTTALPAGATPGDVTVDATILVRQRALAEASTSTPITVRETNSELTVNARPTQEKDSLEIDGRLTGIGGTGIEGRSITVRADGSNVATLETGDDGIYEGVISIDQVDGIDERRDVEIEAAYDDDGNVRRSQASTTVAVATGEEAAPGGPLGVLLAVLGRIPDLFGLSLTDLNIADRSTFGLVHWLLFLVFVIGLPIGSYPLVRHLRSVDGDDEGGSEPVNGAQPDEATTRPEDEYLRASLDDARAFLDGDPAQAVELTYTIVRTCLSENSDETARTHREFYQLCRSNGFSDENLEALKTLTERYEHAAFAEAPVSSVEAQEAIDTAARFVT